MSASASPPAPDTAPRALTNAADSSGRLVSLDALRGFDMFWILGGDAVLQILGGATDLAPFRFLAGQFEHKAWAGFAFYDLIFPLFVFVVGASLVFSLSKTIEREGRAAAVRRVLVRGALLFLIGLFYAGGFSTPWPGIRLLGVLQRIALAYTAAGLLFCFFRPRTLAAIGAALLVGYWALLTFVPIRDFQLEPAAVARRLGIEKPTLEQVRTAYEATTARVSGRYDPGLNLSNHVDFEQLPGRKYDIYWDPEGIVSTLPAIVTCLLGVLAGGLLRRRDRTDAEKLRRLVLTGLAALAVGWLWHLQFPVVKKIWTSSFVLVAGGWSLLLLAAFYYVVDVRRWRGWCQPFLWVGMNAITLYVANNLLGFRRVAQRFAGGDVKTFLDQHVGARAGDLLIAVVGLALMLWLARFLYRRQIFLRV
jgi:predicted acyltransferase